VAYPFLKGKKVLVTGGTGTVGRWLVRELLQHGPEVVRVVDVDESGLFDFSQELGGLGNDQVRFLVGDVRDEERMRRAVEGVDYVVHCAALKHVELSEYNSFEAVKTNILGVQNVIAACTDAEVDKVLFTSSDKAANPSNTMGATKLVGEKLFVAANFAKGPRRTKFSAVRFGNVLGSRGSIIPLFTRQIREGGPVTITHPEMTRFVLTQGECLSSSWARWRPWWAARCSCPECRACA
jgi:UDP-N-acetylglucosamine 4,6-dehydratase/5-epimerase